MSHFLPFTVTNSLTETAKPVRKSKRTRTPVFGNFQPFQLSADIKPALSLGLPLISNPSISSFFSSEPTPFPRAAALCCHHPTALSCVVLGVSDLQPPLTSPEWEATDPVANSIHASWGAQSYFRAGIKTQVSWSQSPIPSANDTGGIWSLTLAWRREARHRQGTITGEGRVEIFTGRWRLQGL